MTILTNGTFAGPGADIQRQHYERVFRTSQPNVTIDFQAAGVTGAEYIAKLLSLTVAGTGPDVLYSGLADMPPRSRTSCPASTRCSSQRSPARSVPPREVRSAALCLI